MKMDINIEVAYRKFINLKTGTKKLLPSVLSSEKEILKKVIFSNQTKNAMIRSIANLRLATGHVIFLEF